MVERRTVEVEGIVQGVGFRPFVYGLASRLALQGFVRNQPNGVLIDIEGDAGRLDEFVEALVGSPPPLASIERIACEKAAPRGYGGFRIERSSRDTDARVFISPDVSTCDACLAELFDPADPRYRYPFLNCTNCGPRFTIVTGAPYDRERTSMAAFRMCEFCRREYEDPANRRFHAQPIACPACGPTLTLIDGRGEVLPHPDPLGTVARALAGGRIVAVKGLGGYHLACDATNEMAVETLRRRKQRDEKPFAIMVRDLAAAHEIAELTEVEARLLESARRPIVIVARRPGAPVVGAVAPGHRTLGIMLPYTPLHHLLLREVQVSLVMTSGNRSDEPIASEDADARARLGGIADLFLVHNRPIQTRCDDSVVRVVGGREMPIRRSRGYAPQPLRLPFRAGRPVLACGGQLKNTFCLATGTHAFVSNHIGDLDHFQAAVAFRREIDAFEALFAARAQVIAYDLHPDYLSTRYALERPAAARTGVQHHHAHVAACLAEHRFGAPVIGFAWDGTGYGSDGRIWGAETIVADYRTFRRAARFRYVALPGGEWAIREPWRVAISHLLDTFGPEARELPLACVQAAGRGWRVLEQMIARRVNAPLASSAGRLFDAAAALMGLRERISYEGQAAIDVETAAGEIRLAEHYPVELWDAGDVIEVDTRPIIRGVVADVLAGVAIDRIAARFHATLCVVIEALAERVRRDSGLDTVALSGGVFLNRHLATILPRQLARAGFRVLTHERVPPGDGGISLGQAAVAAARDAAGELSCN